MKSFEGYLKQTAGDISVLLAGGGIKPLSDFLTTNSLSNYNPTNNFKTINGNSIIGTGDISISGGSGNYVLKIGDIMTGRLTINANETYPLLLRASTAKYSVINFTDNSGTWLADIGWFDESRGKAVYMAGTSSVISVIGSNLWFSDSHSNFLKYLVLHTGNYSTYVLSRADSPFLGSPYWVGTSGWAWNPFGANQTWLNGYSMRRSDWSGDTGDMRFYLSTSPPGCGGMGICMNIDGYIACLSQIYAGNGFVNGSDISLKKNIKSISSYLPLVEFDWKSDGKHTYGFIAQELVALGYSELVGGIDGRMYVNYDAALAMCLAKLSNIVEQLNMNVNDRIAKLEKRVHNLETPPLDN